MPQLSQKDSDDARKRKREMIERIPAMTMAGSRRNKDMVRLKQDLEERARINMMKEAEGKAETMYVDVTRNVGVVLGEIKGILPRTLLHYKERRTWGRTLRSREWTGPLGRTRRTPASLCRSSVCCRPSTSSSGACTQGKPVTAHLYT